MPRFRTVVGAVVAFVAAISLSAQTQTPASNIVVIPPTSSVAHFAGTTGGQAYRDGLGSAARFSGPQSLAVDRNGNIYVGEASTVRRISVTGAVSTFIGKYGVPGTLNGQGGSAQANQISGIAIDSAGNVFIADQQDCVIRKVTPAGATSDFVGQAGQCFASDGFGTSARLAPPRGLTIDNTDALYVTDQFEVRRISPSGSVTTVAGVYGVTGSNDGTGSAAQFNNPTGIAADSAGDLFVADTGNFTIRRITFGAVMTIAGVPGASGSVDGFGSSAHFLSPWGVAADPTGTVYVTESNYGGHIRRVTPGGQVTTVAGSTAGSLDGPGLSAQFGEPMPIAADRAGNLYVGDSINGTIREISPSFAVSTLAGLAPEKGLVDGTGTAARFVFPLDITADPSGNLYVSDQAANAIRKITPAAVVTTFAGGGSAGGADGTGSAAQFDSPTGVASDSSGNIYVADTAGRTIRKITPAGVVTTLAGSFGIAGHVDGNGSFARFSGPVGLTVDSSGNVYVTDGDCTIRAITAAGMVTTLAGTSNVCGSADGTGLAALFSGSRGITVGPGGDLFVADANNQTIRRVTTAGVVTTYAGTAGAQGTADGTGSAASFTIPSGISADAAGNLYVTMPYGLVRKIAPGAVVTTIGPGLNANAESIDGSGSNARILGLYGVVAMPSGDLYLAGSNDAAVRIMRPVIGDLGTASPTTPAVGATTQLDTNPQTATTWEWTLLRQPTGSIAAFGSTIRNPTFTPDFGDVYTFQLKASSSSGIRYSTVDVTASGACLSPLTGATIALTGASGMCTTGTGGTASVTSTSGGLQLSYRWGFRTVSGGAVTDIPGANLLSYTIRGADLGGTGTRYVVVTVVPSCGSPLVSNEIPVTVAASPNTTITAPASVPGLSSGNTASIADAGPGATYGWTIANGSITAGGSTRSITFSARNSGPVNLTVTATNAGGCASTSSASVTVNELAYTFQHFAGTTGGQGAVDGDGTGARVHALGGVAVDKTGTIVFSDDSTLRKLSAAGHVSTLAGVAERPGIFDATGSAAQLYGPAGVAVDASGNVYFMDLFRVRRSTRAGVVTTIAGSTTRGGADGTGAAAQFSTTGQVAVDSLGNVFVADTGGDTIRKVTPAGIVTTFAGTYSQAAFADGTGTAARFNAPRGIAIDSSDNLYVADSNNHTIRKITNTGVVTTYAGSGFQSASINGPLSIARFTTPVAVAVDSAGNVFVAEQSTSTIRMINAAAGIVSTIAGGTFGTADGTGAAAQFGFITAAAADQAGNVIVIDTWFQTVRKVTPAGVVTTIAGAAAAFGSSDGTGSAARFDAPNGIAFAPDGSVYVADTDNETIRKISAAGVVTTVAGRPGFAQYNDGVGTAATFASPQGLALDASGNLWITDGQEIRVMQPSGQVVTVAGSQFSGAVDGFGAGARFNYPAGIAVDPTSGNLFIADSANHLIRKMSPGGVVLTFAGSPGVAGFVDGTGTAARFDYPEGIAVDSAGNVYVADSLNSAIRKITPAGVVTTLVPTSITGPYYDSSIALDSNGDVFFGSTGDPRIFKYEPVSGTLETLGGSSAYSGATDGTGTLARFRGVTAIVEDGNGTLYFSDNQNNCIRFARPTPVPDASTGSSPVTAGTTVQLDTNPQTASTWSWSIVRRPAGSTAAFSNPALRNPTFTPDMPDLYIFMLRAENVTGVRYSTINITATGSCTPTMSAPVASLTGANSFCASSTGGTASVTAAGGADLAYQWAWSATSGGTLNLIHGANGPAYLIRGSDLGGSGAKYLKVTVTPACGTAQVSNEIVLSVQASPDATITTPASVTGFSTGNTASVPNAGAGAAYAWTITNGSITAGAGTQSITYSASSNDTPITLNVTVTAAAGCATSNGTTVTVAPAPFTFTHLAGTTGGAGSSDGPGTAGRFRSIAGAAIDRNGTVYVADAAAYVVRAISRDGSVRTLAGLAYSPGTTDATGSAARFYNLGGVAVDGSGNVYVGDWASVRKIAPNGNVTTLAGITLFTGNADGTGSAARFSNTINGLAVDASGNVFVADTANHEIRKVTPAGVVTTIAGNGTSGFVDGTGAAARFNSPCQIAVDASGTVYVADRNNQVIRSVSSAAVVTTIAGTPFFGGYLDGPAAGAKFSSPEGIAVDGSGNVYVGDRGNHLVRKISGGVVSTLAGGGLAPNPDATGTAARFAAAGALACDRNGDIYVNDSIAVRRIASGAVVTTVAGELQRLGHTEGTGTAALFNNPSGVAVDASGNAYVADGGNNVIRRITPAGVTTTYAGTGIGGETDGTTATATFNHPQAIAIDAAGNLFVADSCVIREITTAGNVTTVAGQTCGFADGVGTAARFLEPSGLVADGSGNVYVVDSFNQVIRKIAPGGVVTTLAGLPGNAGYLDGTGTGARFDYPTAIVMNQAGNLIVSDTYNYRLRTVTPAGVVTTFMPTDAFGNPVGNMSIGAMAIDGSDRLYLVDSSLGALEKVASGILSTIATNLVNGLSGAGSDDGTGDLAHFASPRGIAVDALGQTLWVADTSNDAIRIGRITRTLDIATINLASVTAGTGVQLDTSPQTATSWSWSVIRRPAGSAATLSSATLRNPTFTPDIPDLYRFLVIASGPSGVRYSTVDLTATGACTPALSGAVASLTGASTFCATGGGGTASVTTTGGGAPSYRWGYRTISGGAITDIPGASASSYVLRGSDFGGTGPRFLVVTVTPGCGSPMVSNEIAVSVTAPPNVTITAPSVVVAKSTGLLASVPDAGAGAIYAWTISEGQITSGASSRQILFNAGNESPLTLSVSVTVGSCTNSASAVVSVSTLPYTFRLLAGTAGGSGRYDGPLGASRIYRILGFTIDRNGTLYFTDTNNSVRKMSPAGDVSTLAGLSGSDCGLIDGTRSAARVCGPEGLALDAAGNLWVADTYQYAIRMITPDGVVTTIAGGTYGTADGTGAAAQFERPFGITVDPSGTAYVSDLWSHTIRSVTSAGVVTTIAGSPNSGGVTDGTGSAARFYEPIDLTNDGAGNLYVADYGNHRIRKVTTAGVVTTIAGSTAGYADGTGSAAQFDFPGGIALDPAGNLIVNDDANSVVRKVTLAGVVTTIAGTPRVAGWADGPASTALFNWPTSVAVNSAGTIYIAEWTGSTIRRLSTAGIVTTIGGAGIATGSADGTGSAATMNGPFGIAPDSSGNIYFTDSNNNTIRKIAAGGVVTTIAGTPSTTGGYADGTGAAAQFNNPLGAATDPSGNVYVADYANHVIRRITPAGVVTTFAGIAGVPGSTDGGLGVAKFYNPLGIAVDNSGTVYVADYNNSTIRKITPAGIVSTLAGTAVTFGTADGNGPFARFFRPWGIAVDSAGNVYVADTGNNRIRKITPAGDVTTLAGQGAGWVDGPGTTARFNGPAGIALDPSGNLYVADYNNTRIRKVMPDGTTITIAGQAEDGNVEGTGVLAEVGLPAAIAIDSAGNLYVSDDTNNCVHIGAIALVPDSAFASSPATTGAAFNLDTTPQTPGATYTWSLIRRPAGSAAQLSSSTLRNPSFTPDIPDLYTFLLRAENAGSVRYSTVDVNVTGACTPLSAATASVSGSTSVCATGVAGTASVAATGGAALAYRWGYRTVSGGAITDIPGANNATYLLSGTDLGAPGTKFLVVTVTPGCGTPMVSNETTITVVPALSSVSIAVTGATQVTPTGTAGTATLTYSGGNGVTQQWGYRTTSGGAITNIAGQTGMTYTISGADFAGPGTYFLVATATPSCGSVTTSNEISVLVGSTVATNVVAASNADGTSVHITWTAAIGAASYDVLRSTGGGTFTLQGTVTATSFDDTTTPNSAYLYRIHVTGGADSANAYAGTFVFTDTPLTAGTIVKAVHFTELRTAANTMRALAGLTAATFTNAIAPGVAIQAVDLTELRTAVDQARTALTIPPVVYGEPAITAGTSMVEMTQIQELRQGVR